MKAPRSEWLSAATARVLGCCLESAGSQTDIPGVGLNDRDYWREVPEYLRLTGRGGGRHGNSQPPTHNPQPRARPPARPPHRHSVAVRPAFLWAFVVVMVLTLGGGLAARFDHEGRVTTSPIVVAPLVPSPIPQHLVQAITGTRLLSYGGTLTLSGRAVTQPGLVRVLGRWNTQSWQTFAVANAAGRSYRFVFPMNHRGVLNLKVIQPNGDEAVATYHVS
jgi:hypothetical protein